MIRFVTVFAMIMCMILGGYNSARAGTNASPPKLACNQFDGSAKQRCLEMDLKLRQAELDNWIAISRYNVDAASVDITLGRTQLVRDPEILIIVIVVVGIGLLLSILQFYKSYKTHKLATKDDGQPEPTEVKLSLQGLEIKTATIGLAILAMSLGFFYLYLTIVYTIHLPGTPGM